MMSIDEITETLKGLMKLDLSTMDAQDQFFYMMATAQYAEKLRPLVVKYSDQLPKNTSFLFRMSNEE